MYSEAQQHLGMLNLHLLQMIAKGLLFWEMCDSHLWCYWMRVKLHSLQAQMLKNLPVEDCLIQLLLFL